jgi:hypothetical protein
LETMKFSWIQNVGMYIPNGNHIQWFSSILSVSPLPISQIFNPIHPTFNWWQY